MKKLIIGNLKMNLVSALEREQYFKALKEGMTGRKFSETEIVLCPPFVHLEAFVKNLGKKVKLGAQDMFSENQGSYTGEISPLMLKNFGGEYVILGHSERRRYFSENNDEINLKIISALKNGLKPILCVGETRQEKEEHQTLRVITKQLREALQNVSRTKAEQIVIAYEPVWAVGTDAVPTAHEIMEARVLIVKILSELFERKYAEKVRIVYGGSVSAKTVKQVAVDAGMDGVLVGRESLAPREFLRIVQIINEE